MPSLFEELKRRLPTGLDSPLEAQDDGDSFTLASKENSA